MALATCAVVMAMARVSMDSVVITHLAVEDSGPMDSTEEFLEPIRLLGFSSCD